MEEEKKKTAKRKPGRPRKPVGRGGKRTGSGRKAGVKVGPYKENPRNTMLPFRVSERTARRIKELREITKGDTETFVDMLESWVEELATAYGIE